MASLFLRRSGKYKGRWIYVRDHHQTVAPPTIITAKQARIWARELEAVEPSKPKRKPGTGPTIAELSKRWSRLREQGRNSGDLAASTVKANLSHLHHRIVPDLGEEYVNALDVPRLRAWVRTLQGAPTTRRNVVSTLAAMLDDAIGEGWCSLRSNPARERALRVILPEHRATTRGVDLVLPQLTAAELIACELVPVHRRVRLRGVGREGSTRPWQDVLRHRKGNWAER